MEEPAKTGFQCMLPPLCNIALQCSEVKSRAEQSTEQKVWVGGQDGRHETMPGTCLGAAYQGAALTLPLYTTLLLSAI